MGAKDNFWSSGATGPCGPCSELYYDLRPEQGPEGIDLDDGNRFIEFYNLVFMELNRSADGEMTPLAAKNIDTGLGLERMAQILQGVPNNYETDLIKPIMDKAAEIAGAPRDEPGMQHLTSHAQFSLNLICICRRCLWHVQSIQHCDGFLHN